MPASDHLSTAQFMPMHEIMKLTSVDAEAENDYRADRGEAPMATSVADIMPVKRGDISRYPGRYDMLRESMTTHGQTAPIGVNNGYLVNGGHRVALAHELGWPGMHVTSNFEDTEDRAWNDSYMSKLTGGRPAPVGRPQVR